MEKDKVLFLYDFDGSGTRCCNPHYFSPVQRAAKNEDYTKFAVVGKIEAARENHSLLIDAAEDLRRQGNVNFKIIVVGIDQDRSLQIPSGLRNYFEFTGYIDFRYMYELLESCDFLLPLLDIGREKHIRYIKAATSGLFQLSYGFNIPCIVQRIFAPLRGFTEKNSLLYGQNRELALSMREAMEMTPEAYQDMRRELGKLSADIYQASLANLKRIMENVL
jgi:hypothetical protein